MGIDWVVPTWGLEVDEKAIRVAMAREGQRILQAPGRLPSRSGSFARSIGVVVEGLDVLVGPTTEKHLTIARVFAKRGLDVLAFSPAEEARILQAGQTEFERQIARGSARLKGSR